MTGKPPPVNMQPGTTSPKDYWTRFSTVAPVVSGLLIASVGWWISTSFNEQQIRIQQSSTIDSLTNHITGGDDSKRAAILAVCRLGDPQLVSEFVTLYKSPTVFSALTSIAAAEKQGGQGQSQTIVRTIGSALETIARQHQAAGEFASAQETYELALKVEESVLGSNHPDVARTLGGMASLYRQQGKYNEAEWLLKRAIDIANRSRGPDRPKLEVLNNKLAMLYRAQGRYAEAEPLYWAALVSEHTPLHPDRLSIATDLNNLGVLYTLQGRFEEAKRMLRAALLIRENMLGPRHPDVAISLNDLGVMSTRSRDYNEAEAKLTESLTIRRNMFGESDLLTGESLNNLGLLCLAQGDTSGARKNLEQAFEIRRQRWKDVVDHPDIADSLEALGRVAQAEGNYKEAEQDLTRSSVIRSKLLGANHPKTLEVNDALRHLKQTRPTAK